MFYEIAKLKKMWKYIIGKMNCIDSQNELIIFVKSQNLTKTFKYISNKI